jgi:hypothetical protein
MTGEQPQDRRSVSEPNSTTCTRSSSRATMVATARRAIRSTGWLRVVTAGFAYAAARVPSTDTSARYSGHPQTEPPQLALITPIACT